MNPTAGRVGIHGCCSVLTPARQAVPGWLLLNSCARATVRLAHGQAAPGADAVGAAAILKKRALERDHLLRGFTPQLRLALVQATHAAEDGRKRFGITDPRAARLYARTIVAGTLLSAFLKGEERVILQFAGSDGDPVSRLYAEVLHIGEVRGYAAGSALQKAAAAATGGSAAPGAYWDGLLRRSPGSSMSVTRVLYGAATPYQSIVDVTAGDIEGDLQHYYRQSEQIAAVVRLEADADPVTGRITYAGGVLAEAIAQEGGIHSAEGKDTCTTIEGLGERLRRTRPGLLPLDDLPGYLDDEDDKPELRLSTMHAQGVTLDAVAGQLVPELQGARVESGADDSDIESRGAAVVKGRGSPVLRRVPLDFHCRCKKATFVKKLVETLSPTMLDRMEEEAAPATEGAEPVAASLTCQFCNTSHDVTRVELRAARDIAAAMPGQ